MDQRQNFSKTFAILTSLAFLFGGFTMSIFNEIRLNGILFIIPYIVFFILGIAILKIESNKQKLMENEKGLPFIREFISFDSIISLFILAFFSFFEVFLVIELINFSLEYISKILNPEDQLNLKNSQVLVYFGVLYWIFTLYVKLFKDHALLRWLKGFYYFVVLITLGLISLIFYNPSFFIEFFSSLFTGILNETIYFLHPNTIWNLKIWQSAAGKVFILLILGQFLQKWWRNHISKDNLNLKIGLTSLCIAFFSLGKIINYYIPEIISYASSIDAMQKDKQLLLIGIFAILILLFLLLIPYVSTVLFEQNRRKNYSLTFQESKYLTKYNLLLILTSLIGLSSGVLFIFVDFKEYYYWIGMLFILLLTISYVIHIKNNFSFNKIKRRFNDRIVDNQLSPVDKLLLQIIIPIFLIPVLLISIPDYFSNFIGNKQLTHKIESLQDLGRITSNHHSLEPFILRDYNKIIIDIDSNKVKLDKIDSLNSIQKDSIKYYLENRNYKLNEVFRINQLQFHHDVLFVKNFSKWALLLFILLFFLFYRFKLKQ